MEQQDGNSDADARAEFSDLDLGKSEIQKSAYLLFPLLECTHQSTRIRYEVYFEVSI